MKSDRISIKADDAARILAILTRATADAPKDSATELLESQRLLALAVVDSDHRENVAELLGRRALP